MLICSSGYSREFIVGLGSADTSKSMILSSLLVKVFGSKELYIPPAANIMAHS